MNSDPIDIKRIPGWLCWNPTDLSAAFPHGGTALGVVRAKELVIGQKIGIVFAEEDSGHAVEGSYDGEACIFNGVLRSWDKDMLLKIYPNAAAGASSGETVLKVRRDGAGITRGGTRLSARGGCLLFSPENINLHPFAIIYRALPYAPEQAMISLGMPKEVGIGFSFLGVPDDTGRVQDTGLREDISL